MNEKMTDKEKVTARAMNADMNAMFLKYVREDAPGKEMMDNVLLLTNLLVGRIVSLTASIVTYRLTQDDVPDLASAYEVVNDMCQEMKHAIIKEIFACAKHMKQTSGGRVNLKL